MENQEQGRRAPYDNLAEMSVLGWMLIDQEAIDTVSAIIKANDFYNNSHQIIYEAILKLSEEGGAIDYITINNHLQKIGLLDKVGGLKYLTELTQFSGSVSNVAEYARIVKDKAVLRALIKVGSSIVERSYANEKTESILEEAERAIYSISQGNIHRDLEPISDIMQETLQRIEEVCLATDRLTGITTGIESLNNTLSGLQDSDLILLAARPSMGKTALCLNLALAAARDNKNVAIFSLEMSKIQLVQRLLSCGSTLGLSDIIHGHIDDWMALTMGCDQLSSLGIYIDDTSGISLTELRSKSRRLASVLHNRSRNKSAKQSQRLDLIIIDYLQLMSVDSSDGNRQQEISTISRGLKGLAKDLSCPVLALSQLSRAPEARKDHRPIMSDLRESGAIEQDADVIMMLYRDDYYDPENAEAGETELHITKHRNGPTGVLRIRFDKEKGTFSDYTTDEF